MKRILLQSVLAAFALTCGYFFWMRHFAEQELVIISTTDLHSDINNMPRLATAVKMSRDTVRTLLVDSGDRWTGNAYVDMAAEPRRPIIDMMNALGYDVATLGNHEWDAGHPFLGYINTSVAKFDVVCANCKSDTISFPQPDAYKIFRFGGKRIGFVGAVNNFDNGHPSGKAESYEGLRFEDPKRAAIKYARRLRGDCELLVLLSHVGDDVDRELAAEFDLYDLILCGHTHNKLDTLIGRTQLGQSGSGSKRIGVSRVVIKGKAIKSLEYDIVELASYEEDAQMKEWVDRVYDNEALNRPIGRSVKLLDKIGIAAWETSAMKAHFGVDVAFYHYGGIRFDEMPSEDISTGMIFGVEPYSSKVYTMVMTGAQIERMILAKYNDRENMRESHRLDIFSTEPYVIHLDESGDAIRVEFENLVPEAEYKVAMGDYMFNNYKDIVCRDLVRTDVLLTDILMNDLASNTPIDYSNTPIQAIKR
ncbi:MAG: bifunctional metallophosphatase/5'-nucleotidase [Alistipes sp.]|nr:bifunctional metallophosphatase/5'-nucleotidase [Alistipes sp.]